MKKVRVCRLCGGGWAENHGWTLKNLPDRAQKFRRKGDSSRREKKAHLNLQECARCGVVQHTNRPVSYYREVIRAGGFSPAYLAFRRRQLAGWVRTHRLVGKTVLEVGSGAGEMLEILRESGAKPVGLEWGTGNLQECRKKGLKVLRGYLGQNLRFPPGSFDAVLSFNYFEHLPDLSLVLDNVRNLLRPGGVVLLEVPNAEMILSGGRVMELIPDHIFYFREETFVRILEGFGFSVDSVEILWNGYLLSVQARKRPPTSWEPCRLGLRAYQAHFRNFFHSLSGKSLVIWGAGHEALATLSVLGLRSKIRFIVDNATWKQHRLAPGSGIPIMPPESLLRIRKTTPVLILAGSYKEEILQTAPRSPWLHYFTYDERGGIRRAR